MDWPELLFVTLLLHNFEVGSGEWMSYDIIQQRSKMVIVWGFMPVVA